MCVSSYCFHPGEIPPKTRIGVQPKGVESTGGLGAVSIQPAEMLDLALRLVTPDKQYTLHRPATDSP